MKQGATERMTSSKDPKRPFVKMLTAGTAACIADLATFPLDTAKVRMQIAGEGQALLLASPVESMVAVRPTQPGLLQTMGNIVRVEGARSLYGGLSAGLQRQMCFASIRLGLYDTVKAIYAGIFDENKGWVNFGIRIGAGITTGMLAVLFAQPTDIVKVRQQAGKSSVKYNSTIQAYKSIISMEGPRGLWRGTLPNISRNAIVNVAETVSYDILKDRIISSGYFRDGIPCHFVAATATGLLTTFVSNPVDVVKTRYMNSSPSEYKGAMDCAVRMLFQEGPQAFYKGFVPSFTRLVSWNIVLWITYEQIKIQVKEIYGNE